MPLLLIVLLLLLLLPLFVLSLPLSIIMRYRTGTARRAARGWIATINLVGFGTSAVLLLAGAAVMNLWVPRAILLSVMGLVAGGVLGVAGLATTRWEVTPDSLHYTPNRWLVLSITLLVAARLGYGFWRGWHAWRVTPDPASWLAASGAAGSLGAGALVLGYYLIFWVGVQRRFDHHRLLTGGARRRF